MINKKRYFLRSFSIDCPSKRILLPSIRFEIILQTIPKDIDDSLQSFTFQIFISYSPRNCDNTNHYPISPSSDKISNISIPKLPTSFSSWQLRINPLPSFSLFVAKKRRNEKGARSGGQVANLIEQRHATREPRATVPRGKSGSSVSDNSERNGVSIESPCHEVSSARGLSLAGVAG